MGVLPEYGLEPGRFVLHRFEQFRSIVELFGGRIVFEAVQQLCEPRGAKIRRQSAQTVGGETHLVAATRFNSRGHPPEQIRRIFRVQANEFREQAGVAP